MTDVNENQSPAAEIVEAVAETILHPNPVTIAEDLLLAHRLAGEIREKLAGKHPSVFATLIAVLTGDKEMQDAS